MVSPGEYEALMASLEAALYDDILREEAEYLDSLDQQDVEDMVEAHFGALALGSSEGMDGVGGDDANANDVDNDDIVVCPLCQHALLVQHKGVIMCPRKDLRLDIGIEGVLLRDVKRRLAGVLAGHAASGCGGQARFEQRGQGKRASLMMLCDHCGALEVVL